MQLVMAVAEGEGTGGHSFSTSKSVEETSEEPATSCTRLCWELLLRGVFRRRERGPISYAITFLDDMAVHVPTLDAWDQFVWLPSVAIPRTAMQVEQYGYCHGNAIDLSAVMPVMEFRVTDKRGPIYAWCRPSFMKGASWHTIPPGTRWSGSLPTGSPTILAGWRREWWSHWQILCHAPPRRRTASQSSGPTTS